ncbi:MAG: CPBP family intramembrane metalloprotease [Labilithrix sp.]|nr:CPBP family intramembrane metalloprotease [Labilithrix sp.]MCW5810414.1 CPBP family intramembrane metalloprotease [Labilithrix sp.]
MAAAAPAADSLTAKPGAWVDLGLTLPIFLVYHLAVVFLGVQNATDVVTGTLLSLSAGNKTTYLLSTLAIGVIFAGTFALAGRGQAFRPRKFLQIAIEGVVYAFTMAVFASYVVGSIFAGPSSIRDEGRFVGFIMSLGAGFYEELTFRVILFGLGAKVLVKVFGNQKVELAGTQIVTRFSFRSWMVMFGWAVASALVFSGVHYVGSMSDTFHLTSFTFRAVLGLVLTLIFVTRGFAAAVWTHAIYDVWVLVFHA